MIVNFRFGKNGRYKLRQKFGFECFFIRQVGARCSDVLGSSLGLRNLNYALMRRINCNTLFEPLLSSGSI
jgi:hypothetical protein